VKNLNNFIQLVIVAGVIQVMILFITFKFNITSIKENNIENTEFKPFQYYYTIVDEDNPFKTINQKSMIIYIYEIKDGYCKYVYCTIDSTDNLIKNKYIMSNSFDHLQFFDYKHLDDKVLINILK